MADTSFTGEVEAAVFSIVDNAQGCVLIVFLTVGWLLGCG